MKIVYNGVVYEYECDNSGKVVFLSEQPQFSAFVSSNETAPFVVSFGARINRDMQEKVYLNFLRRVLNDVVAQITDIHNIETYRDKLNPMINELLKRIFSNYQESKTLETVSTFISSMLAVSPFVLNYFREYNKSIMLRDEGFEHEKQNIFISGEENIQDVWAKKQKDIVRLVPILFSADAKTEENEKIFITNSSSQRICSGVWIFGRGYSVFIVPYNRQGKLVADVYYSGIAEGKLNSLFQNIVSTPYRVGMNYIEQFLNK